MNVGVKGDTVYRLADQSVQPLIHQRSVEQFRTQVDNQDVAEK
jgi:hypothetical protein